MALSMRGIARQYLYVLSTFSVRYQFFDGAISGRFSLRERLESLARKEVSVKYSECIYAFKAAYEQTWSHIVVRIHLNYDSGISAATMNTLRATWETGIETTWSNRWAVGRAGEAALPLTFDVQWVVTNYPHHTVRVHPGSGDTNVKNWYTNTNNAGDVAAHEFGHMLGHPDEYPSPFCPDRSPVGTGTVMHTNSNNVPMRLMQRFADYLASYVVPLP